MAVASSEQARQIELFAARADDADADFSGLCV